MALQNASLLDAVGKQCKPKQTETPTKSMLLKSKTQLRRTWLQWLLIWCELEVVEYHYEIMTLKITLKNQSNVEK